MSKVTDTQGWLKLLVILLVIVVAGLAQNAAAMTDEDCLDCHTDPDLTVEVDGKTVQLTVDEKKYKGSVHADNDCVSCHEEADVDEAPHPYPMAKVDCANCHDGIATIFANSLHGQALKKNDPYAPKCIDCHGKHDILSQQDKKSPTYIMNVPFTCGRCHQEGSPMTLTHDIPKKNILKNFSMSIHGEGLFRKGLTVTAVCTSCHTAHNVLPHTDPKSTISRLNVVKTCMKCHANIEEAHTKIVRGELWETEPHKVPACVECHGPHQARRVLYEDSLNDLFCLKCHGNPDLKIIMANGNERSLFVNVEDFEHSIHKEKRIACAKCHVNVDHQKNPVCKDSGKVDCSICHAQVVDRYNKSTHGMLAAKNDTNAPVCSDCHGTHNIMARSNSQSPIFARNIPELCASCHREGQKAALRYTGTQHDIIKHYQMSIHGRGLSQSGLMVSASCTNCHTAHSMLPASNPESSVNRNAIVKTCAQCHLGIAEKFSSSIHSSTVSKTEKKLPVCNDCHTSHTISRHDTAGFRGQILDECGTCHEHETDTYFETYHGKASMLSGGEKTAKCSDCHGSHDILPAYYSESNLNRRHVVETCRKCHPGSNRKFTGYLTHATHHDRDKYPYLYYTFWSMTGLLVGTFAFFGIHTLFWIPRSFRERFKKRREHSRENILKKDDSA